MRRFARSRVAAFCVGAAVVALAAGCRKQVSTLPVPARAPAADTAVSRPSPLVNVDTSDNAVFREAQLAEDLARQVKENLRPVYFEYNSHVLTHEAMDNLARAGSFLNDHRGLRLLLEGHCDERGSSEYNMGLGEDRAKAVKHYLENYGVSGHLLETTSWGKERPAASGCNGDESCHRLNRRVEFKVIEGR